MSGGRFRCTTSTEKTEKQPIQPSQIDYFNGDWGFTVDGDHFFWYELTVSAAVNRADLADDFGGDSDDIQ